MRSRGCSGRRRPIEPPASSRIRATLATISPWASSGARIHSPRMAVPWDQTRHCSTSANGIAYVATSVRTSARPAARNSSSTPASSAYTLGIVVVPGPGPGGAYSSDRSSIDCQVGGHGRNVAAPRWPPGTSNRVHRRRASVGSGRKNSTSEDATTSYDAASSCGSVASPSATRTWGRCRVSAESRSTMPGEMSIASTCPSGPTASASRRVTAPRPAPMSSTRSPGRGESRSTRPPAMVP